MDSRQRPRSGEFVVRLKAPRRGEAGLEPVAEGTYLLSSGGKGRDAREAWRRLLQEHPDVEWAAPVLEGPDGSAHLPTGEVTVRFETPPSAAELERFARAHGLELRRRNEFAPAQAVFAPCRLPETYLPDLVEDLDRAEGVQSAWANTLSRYRRS